ncbi:hypothetical protein [Polymorphobacter sp.]|uniref:hypothetical protein n=1 Tax=Polymorphobacter sp. TaxID=1909290 RepID=UPI003F6FC77A
MKVVMMRHFALAASLALAVTGPLAPLAAAEPETRACIDSRSIRATQFSAEQGYFVRSGGKWFQNRAGGCPLFKEDRSIRTNSTIGRQCNGDQVQVYQPVTNLEFGNCTLGDWTEVPATSVPKK